MREQADQLAWRTTIGREAAIMLGKKRLGYAYGSAENDHELHKRLDEICLRYNTWVQIWLALKAAERGDKYWLTEVKAAIKAAGEGGSEKIPALAIQE